MTPGTGGEPLAYLPDGTECPVGPWLTAYAAADAVWLIATAERQVA